MRGTEFPITFSFEFAGFPLDMEGETASASSTAGPGIVKVLPISALLIDERLAAYPSSLVMVLNLTPEGLGGIASLIPPLMQLLANLQGDVIASGAIVVAGVETVQDLQGEAITNGSATEGEMVKVLTLEGLTPVESSTTLPASLAFLLDLTVGPVSEGTDLLPVAMKLGVKLHGQAIAGDLDIEAEVEIVQKCEGEAIPFIYPAAPPSPWWPEDFFIYQAPEPLQGLERPLIGEIWGEPPWVLRAISGEGSTMIEPEMQKVPFQIGETFLNSRVNPRVIAMTIRVIGQETAVGDEMVSARRNLFFLRNLLSQALVVQPLERPESGERPNLGRLIYFRQNFPVFSLDVIPRNSPQFVDIPGTDQAVDAEIELVAPDPYWRDQGIPATRGRQSRQCWFYPSGGMEFEMSFSFEFTGQIYVQEILNRGDVRTPIVFELRGPVDEDGLTLRNDTTGEQLAIAGPVAQDETLVISTEFGQKYVHLVNQVSGAVTDAFSRVDFQQSSFWKLERGINQVTLVTSGAAATTIGRILWYNRFSGV